MLKKPASITRVKASIIKGSDAKIRTNAVIIEIGKPSERMLICGDALEINPVVSDVKNKVPRIGIEIIIASRNKRERPEASIVIMCSLPSISEIMLIVCTERQKPPRKS